MQLITNVLNLICYYIIYLPKYCSDNEILNLSDYNYPKRETGGNEYTIAILGTNDIHGFAYSRQFKHPISAEEYTYGGLEYLATYVDILREDFQERFLWLDSGDQFQGGIETKLSNGTIMTDFFNEMKLNTAAIGNHEFDFGKTFLYERLQEADFNYLAANIINNQTGSTGFLPNTKVAKIFTIGEIKVGVIGLSTVDTPFTTSGDITGIKFAQYRDIVIKLSQTLRDMGANAVILNSHVGMACNLDRDIKMTLRLRNNTSAQAECREGDEIMTLLESLDLGIIDAVVGGHVHDVVHHWVKGVPVIQSVAAGYYSNILYLKFERNSKKLILDDTIVEGPVPTCAKIFKNTKRCEYVSQTDADKTGPLLNFKFHERLLTPNKSIQVLFMKWYDEVKKYKVVIGNTDSEMGRIVTGDSLLGNLATDAIRNITQADIAILNTGGFRTTIYPGNILLEDMYNMFPFDNEITSWEMTGVEVKRMIQTIQTGKMALYPVSGLSIKMKKNPLTVLDIRLTNSNTPLIDEKVYTVSGIDFLIPFGGDDFNNVIDWYTPIGVKKFGFERQNMIEYIKRVGNIKHEDYVSDYNKRIEFIE